MKKIIILLLLFMYACGSIDRSTMNSVRLKSDTTTDSIEYVVKEMLVAINKAYASLDKAVSDGDEVAFFPPVTGG